MALITGYTNLANVYFLLARPEYFFIYTTLSVNSPNTQIITITISNNTANTTKYNIADSCAN